MADFPQFKDDISGQFLFNFCYFFSFIDTTQHYSKENPKFYKVNARGLAMETFYLFN